jgi:hypothetical protein
MRTLNASETDIRILLETLGVGMGMLNDKIRVASLLEGEGDEYRPYFLEGLGFGIRGYSWEKCRSLTFALDHLQDWGVVFFSEVLHDIDTYSFLMAEDKSFVYRGAFSHFPNLVFLIYPGFYERSFNFFDLYPFLNSHMDKRYLPFVYEGIGKALGLELLRGKLPYERAVFFLNGIRSEYQPAAFKGLSMAS